MKATSLVILFVFLFLSRAHSQSIYHEEFISAPGLFPANHGSTLVDLPNGLLLSCWYAGTKEKATDVQVYCSQRAKDAEDAWTTPAVAVARQEKNPGSLFRYRSLGNAVLYLDNEQVLWLFYTPIMFFDGWSAAHVDYKTSTDLGKTWSKAKSFKSFFGNLAKNKPIKIDDQHFMLPLYHELTSHTGYTCTIKHKAGKILEEDCKKIYGNDQIQPSIVRPKPEELFAYMRMNKHVNIGVSKFNFKLNQWSLTEPTNLPNPDAGVDTVTTEDGTILIVYNDSYEGRNILSLAFSKDGKEFKKIWDFENGIDCSYPAIIRSKDGQFHVSYTYDFRGAIKHVNFNSEWLKSQMK